MPSQKDLKRLVRARMTKTGEAYTTARQRLLQKKGSTPRGATASAAATASPPPDYGTLAGMSDEALKAKTGCDWARWVYVLDKLGAAEKPHREIARLVHEKYKIEGWWAQTVTVGYERIRGLREIGQRRDGLYEASKSKTFKVPIAKLYRAFHNRQMRDRWLPGVSLSVRAATKEKSMRFTWDDGTRVQAYFTKKGAAKAQVAVQHTKLSSKAAVAERKAFWTERLAALAEMLA